MTVEREYPDPMALPAPLSSSVGAAFYSPDVVVALCSFRAQAGGLGMTARVYTQNIDFEQAHFWFDIGVDVDDPGTLRMNATTDDGTNLTCHPTSGGGGPAGEGLLSWTFELWIPLDTTTAAGTVDLHVTWEKTALNGHCYVNRNDIHHAAAVSTANIFG